ncbi:MAG TPA: MerR family transcriptional regulator [Arachnia sp.]|nr:MerR family transcriptional regulator [Arachnia sp.]HMT85381.1 MerR family transcriptional regulator [Arachnia sp.]
MLSIGAFAQIAQVTHRQLRHWDSVGLLVPAHVDEFNGYRSYDPSQLQRVHRIVALRRLGFGIEDIAAVLAQGVDTGFLAELLRVRRSEVEREYRIAAATLVDVERRLHLIETENQMSTIEFVEKPLPALRLAARTAVVADQPEIESALVPMFDDIAEVIGDVPGALDTPVALYEPVEEGMQVTAGYVYNGEPLAGFEIIEVPAVGVAVCGVHLGSMERVANSWQALHADLLARGYVPSAACRELYVRAYPEDQTDWVTELQQPVELPR